MASMQAQRISPAIAALPSQAASAADAATPAQPFTAVLTQEMTARAQGGPDSTASMQAEAAGGARSEDATPQAQAGAQDGTTGATAPTPAEAGKATDTGTDADTLPEPLAAFVASLLQMQASVGAPAVPGKKSLKSGEQDRTPDAALALAASGAARQPPGDGLPGLTDRLQENQAIDAHDAGAGAVPERHGREIASLRAAMAQIAGETGNEPAKSDVDTATRFDGSLQAATLQAAPAAAAAAAAPPMAPPTASLAPPVGTAAWDQALAQRVTWMVSGDQQSATLTLNPPELGPLQVVLNISKTHADASFIASQPEVRQALEAALPKLRDMLGEAGISLGQASVGSGSADSQGRSGAPARDGGRGGLLTEGPGMVAAGAGALPVIGGRGLIDTFA